MLRGRLLCVPTYFGVLEYCKDVHAMVAVGVEPKTEGKLLDWGYLFLHPTVCHWDSHGQRHIFPITNAIHPAGGG
jgi:hypothetical protein